MSMTTGCLAGPVAAVVTAVSVHLAEGTTTNTTTIRYQPVILLHQVSLVSEEDMR